MSEGLMFVNGEWKRSEKGEVIHVVDPSTGLPYTTVPAASSEDIKEAVDSARVAFDSGPWPRMSPSDRFQILNRLADMVAAEVGDIAKMETRNTGKTIKQTMNYDIPYSVDNMRFLAGASRIMDGIAASEYSVDGTSFLRREPIGVVAVITPWNYPFLLNAWRTFAALSVGNTVVLKPSSLTPMTTLEFAKLADKAGVPKGAINVVTGGGSTVGEKLAGEAKVDMIAFTGSTEVGSRLQEIGAKSVKKVSLELGGKAPFIVFKDADIDAAAEGAIIGGLINNGQDCANATRFYVQREVMSDFTERLKRNISRVKVGDPAKNDTDMGPLISSKQRDRVEEFIRLGLEEGGRLMHGGERPKVDGHEGGYYISPTVIYTENENSAIVKEEIFGPVLTVLPFDGYDDAIFRSNDVTYGLCASVWTKDVSKAMRAIRDLRFGTVWANEHLPVPSELPWGGYKQSGIGVSMSKYALEEFTVIKHAYVDLTGKIRKSWYYQVYGQP